MIVSTKNWWTLCSYNNYLDSIWNRRTLTKDLRTSAEDAVKLAGAPNSITGLNVSSTGNGKAIITIGLAQPLANLPAGFTTDDPPRIILDFINTKNSLGKSVQDSHEGGLHSTNIVQAAGRTRLVVNLNRDFL